MSNVRPVSALGDAVTARGTGHQSGPAGAAGLRAPRGHAPRHAARGARRAARRVGVNILTLGAWDAAEEWSNKKYKIR